MSTLIAILGPVIIWLVARHRMHPDSVTLIIALYLMIGVPMLLWMSL